MTQTVVVCDRCGARETLRLPDKTIPAGWLGAERSPLCYCPPCAKLVQYERNRT